MNSLVPRWFGDFADWLEAERPFHPGRMIRVEDSMSEQEYRVRAELPGMDPEQDIHVSVDGGVLAIRAERKTEEKTDGHSEFQYGMLQRAVRLPVNADTEGVKATYDNGILEVVVPLRSGTPTAHTVPITR